MAVVALAACLVQASCTLGGGGPTEQLAADQTLSFPISNEIGDFDPAQITSPADVDILRNVFSGLYGFDEHLHLVPDIATSFPDISADGLTYTFRLRHDAHFSNGDPITADDVIFSWNRAAAKQGELAPLFSPIRGYELVAQGRSKQLGGLTKTDAYTVVVTLSAAAGYWLTRRSCRRPARTCGSPNQAHSSAAGLSSSPLTLLASPSTSRRWRTGTAARPARSCECTSRSRPTRRPSFPSTSRACSASSATGANR